MPLGMKTEESWICRSSSLQGGPAHRATENGLGNEALSACHSLCILTSTATMWTEEGFCSPIQNMDLEETYLLMGLEVRPRDKHMILFTFI